MAFLETNRIDLDVTDHQYHMRFSNKIQKFQWRDESDHFEAESLLTALSSLSASELVGEPKSPTQTAGLNSRKNAPANPRRLRQGL
jgi:hypothetical protein